ncbi:flagella synthesis protein FlgN [Entomohabitans teleogrylli]|uniref:flagella synthesis protein FlgN n=1 Tax=Entomohabitans teleogrylli TaxID=1384589 RepID=UPI00073D7053|nr:flagellar export chaperone FlgN [Entomohabitans teleogrylli]
MEKLHAILVKMQDSMTELETVITEEMEQLRRPQINPVLLQIVSDNKSRLLSTISHYDKLRVREEQRLHISAPYHQHKLFAARWKKISRCADNANRANQDIYVLLEMHMQKSTQLQAMLNKAGDRATLYNPQGEEKKTLSGKIYNLSI